MKKNAEELVRELKRRRSGIDRVGVVSFSDGELIRKREHFREAYETKATGAFTTYALGAMQAVDADYTRISVETARRVENQLQTRLPPAGFSVEFRLQGSVPLNVHIRGVSDVDLLTLGQRLLVYAGDGVRARRGEYARSEETAADFLKSLRGTVEAELPLAFPATTVDTSGARAIKISGGSLARPVDVVPSVWYDTAPYQLSGREVERGVAIYDKSRHATIDNFPFLHIERIKLRCDEAGGSLRKAIRLCKNIKADAEAEGTSIHLSSYEIAGLMYHADQAKLRNGAMVNELTILAETQRHLEWLRSNPDQATQLTTPDGSRRILNEDGKLNALATLSSEISELLAEVARDQSGGIGGYPQSHEDRRRFVESLIFR